MHGDRLATEAHLDVDAVVAQQQVQLLAQVVLEQVRARDRGLVGARARHKAIRQAGVSPGHRVGVDADEGVFGTHRVGQRLAGHKPLQGLPQVVDLGVVDGLDLLQGSLRVVKTTGNHLGGFVAVLVHGEALRKLR